MTIYHKYRLDDSRYWGSTDIWADDPECGYTEIEPPVYEYPDTIPVWTGTAWVVKQLIAGQVAPD